MWILLLFDVFYQSGHKASIDHGLDRWVLGDGKDLTDADDSVMLLDDILIVEGVDEFTERVHGVSSS